MTPKRLAPFLFAVALAGAAALAACAGSHSSSASPADAPTPGILTPTSVPTQSLCDLPGGWYFQGSCTAAFVASGGEMFSLPAYRGISITATYGANDAADKVPFVVGDAIGDGDITGKLNGKVPFSPFGIAKCRASTGAPLECTGRAVAYLIVVNAGKVPVTFKATPTIVVSNLSGFTSRDCGIATMIWLDPILLEAGWVVEPGSVIPNGQTLRFDSKPIRQVYGNRGNFTILAIVCR